MPIVTKKSIYDGASGGRQGLVVDIKTAYDAFISAGFYAGKD